MDDVAKASRTIASIIVGYRNESLTTEFVQKELSKLDVETIVVVVNNSSTVESCRILREKLNACIVGADFSCYESGHRVYVLDVKENLGFAKANNLGVSFISRFFPEIEYVLFTNNDIRIVDPQVVRVLIDKYESVEGIGVIGPNILHVDGTRQTPMPMSYLWSNIWETLSSPLMSIIKHQPVEYCDLAQEGFHYTFAECFFISRLKDYVACGMMDPHTFLYAEGCILSERMSKIGLGYYFVPDMTVIHDNGSTTRKYLGTVVYKMISQSNAYYYQAYRGYSAFSVWCFLTVSNMMCKLAAIKRSLKKRS